MKNLSKPDPCVEDIKLTKKQIELLRPLRDAILKRASEHPLSIGGAVVGEATLFFGCSHPRFTMSFYYMTPEKFEIVNRAVRRARKLRTINK